MNIKGISFGSINAVDQNKKTNAVTVSSKKDSFEKTEEFNPEKAEQFLKDVKFDNGEPKFKIDSYRNNIIREVTQAPEKWTYVKQLATRKNVSADYLSFFSSLNTEKLGKITEVANLDDRKGNPKFKDYQLSEVASYENEMLENARLLAKTELEPANIIKAVHEKDIDYKKLAKKVDEVADLAGDDVKEVIFARDAYSKGDYTITATKKNNSQITQIVDKNMKRYAMETVDYYASKDKEYQIKKSVDYRNNTVSKIRAEKNQFKKYTATHEVRIIKDKNGNVKRTEYTEPSEVKGVMNITYKYPGGKTEVVSSGTIDKKTGITTVRKNMVSSLGTKTEYLFQDDPQGNRLSDYKITDKNGKVLLQNSETFEVVNDNKFISSKNNEKYEIVIENGEFIKVQDMNNPKRNATFVNGTHIRGNREEILKVFKQMPGEELLKLNENVAFVEGTKDVLRSYTQKDLTHSKIYTGNDLFIILHELGHAVDTKDVNMFYADREMDKAIFADKKFNEIYAKEKDAFNKAFPDAQRNHIAYFIDHENHYNGEAGGKKETIAESNALLTTPKSHNLLALRSQYLQQHFPETIAYLDGKLNEGKQSKKYNN